MRADRLLSILLLLETHRRMTAREFAQRLEVSERTIHRDMEALSLSGVPVVAERGAGGGWTLLDGYHTTLTGLNEAEVRSLFLTPPARLLGDLGLQRAAGAASLKLLASLPEFARKHAELARQRLYVDAAGWNQQEESAPFLPLMQEAIWTQTQVRMVYRKSDDSVVDRTVHPFGLVAKGTVWYLVAGTSDGTRTYRVARIQRAELTRDQAVTPPGFDLVRYWHESSARFIASFARFAVVMRVHPDLREWLSASASIRVVEMDDPDERGWSRALALFEGEHHACTYALAHGPHVEVLAPPELRARVTAAVQATGVLYGEDAAGVPAQEPVNTDGQ